MSCASCPKEWWLADPILLESFIRQNKNAPWVALDTEFLFQNTYYPQLCLLQVATEEHAAIIDVLALNHLEPLRSWLEDKLKILHAGYQDLLILQKLWQKPLLPLFDTQIAASLLGYGHQIGYAALVAEVLQIHLDKQYTRINWCQRPLSEEQKRYALDDVIYLGALYQKLAKDLDQQQWQRLQQKQQRYLHQEVKPEKAWRRVSEWQRLRPQQLKVLKKLAAWRELEAQAQNKPRRQIISDEVLIYLASLQPKSLPQLASIKPLNPAIIRHHGQQLLHLIAQALDD